MTNWTTVSFSGSTLIHRVGWLVGYIRLAWYSARSLDIFSWGTQFKSRTCCRLSWLWFFVNIFSVFRLIPLHCLQICHNYLLPNPYRLSIDCRLSISFDAK